MIDLPSLSQFNAFDWVAVLVIALSALLSLWRGFVREAIALSGWIVAYVVANLFAMQVAELIGDLIANRTGRYIVAWTLLFVSALVLSSVVAKILAKAVKATGLGVVDRLLGSVFGMLRGALIVMAIVFVVREVIPKSEQSLLLESELMPHIDLLLSWSLGLFEEFRDVEIKGLTT
ncbi:MAG: CvpA family protein [Congregibacter sp.]